ncbi:alkaline phosphatase [Pontibacillus yanchengensis]|uniref:Alkaline phosphatase n=2 Tax=Pontibacillus yanchengensis TaxID=462910 RepID=A0A6I5A1U8_9BACI|nr:alkaline phosphatase [Pontibacillus yanchengensis]MYL54321.1 alkaline phosphatase [Pontibacillus yanchengensis]
MLFLQLYSKYGRGISLRKNKLSLKVLSIAAVTSMVLSGFTGVSSVSADDHMDKKHKENKHHKIENVIFLIGDGMGPAYTTAYRYLKDDPSTEMMEPTGFDPYLVGMQKTNADDPEENITDSSAAATSMSSGIKTYNGAVAVDNDESEVETVLEQAKENGKSTGLVATSHINHATPASYGTHNVSRNNYNEIADDYYDELIDGEHKVDVLLGGGTNYFDREDRDLTKEFQEDGYSYVTTSEELENDDNEQVIGLFAPVGLPKMKDRTEEIPSLKEMTTSAIDRLNKDEDGFFLMVEGSQIDWAGHGNDIVGAMSEMEDFEKAFNAAIEFAKKDKHTLVVATADHSTGGLSIGRGGPYKFDPQAIKDVKRTPDFFAEKIENGANVKDILNEYTEFEITDEEAQSVEEAKEQLDENSYAVSDAVAEIFNVRARAGWTTGGHTGVDVQVYAYGPGKEMFMGMTDNTDQAKSIFKVLENDKARDDHGKDDDDDKKKDHVKFKDFDKDDFGFKEVQDLVMKDIIHGFMDNTFKPQNKITVRQAEILLENSTDEEVEVEMEGDLTFGKLAELFVDTLDLGETGSFEENVETMKDAGIFTEVEYTANDNVPRVKFSIFLHRALNN